MKFHNNSSNRRNFLAGVLSAVGVAVSFLLPHSSFAEEAAWPTQPVKIIVATGPGSTTDSVARTLAPRLQDIWKQPVVVENKAGAGGIIGSEYTLASRDGHTLLMASPSLLLAKFTTPNLRFDPVTDMIPVYRLFKAPMVFVTNAGTAQRARTMAEMVTLSRSTPKGVFFAAAGKAGIMNQAMEAMSDSLQIRYSAVHFNGMGSLIVALLRNDAQLALSGHAAVKGQIDSRELHALAVVDNQRLATLPDVPTLEEAVGYKGFVPVSWGGIFAPRGTPAAVVDIIARDFGALYADESLRNSLESRFSISMVQSSPTQFAAEYGEEADSWKAISQREVVSK